MCYSASLSLATYLFSMGSAATLWIFHKKVPNVLFFNFVHMQLCEYFMWSDQSCTGTNQVASKAGLVLLASQPLCSMLSASPYFEIPDVKPAVVATYVSFAAYVISRKLIIMPDSPIWCSTGDECSRLGLMRWVWLYNGGICDAIDTIVYMSLSIPTIVMKKRSRLPGNRTVERISSSMFVATLIYSLAYAWDTKTWGSSWCIMVNARSIGYYMGY